MTAVDEVSVSRRRRARFAGLTAAVVTVSARSGGLSGSGVARYRRQSVAGWSAAAAREGVGEPANATRTGAPTDHHGAEHTPVAGAPADTPTRQCALLARPGTGWGAAHRKGIVTRTRAWSRHTPSGVGRHRPQHGPGAPWIIPTAATGRTDEPGRTHTTRPGCGPALARHPQPCRVDGRRDGALTWRCGGRGMGGALPGCRAGGGLIAVGRAPGLEHRGWWPGRTNADARSLERHGANHTSHIHAAPTATFINAASQTT